MEIDTEKMVDEALAMKLAVTGDAHGDYFHAFNWSDKPHRVVYDAAKIINAAAAELATLRAEVERLREALRDCEGWIRRYHYEDRPDLADKAKEALK